MICKSCKTQVSDKATSCPVCGANPNHVSRKKDERNILLNVISFLCPPVGIAYFLANKKKTPIKARSALSSAVAFFTVIAMLIAIIFVYTYFIDPSVSYDTAIFL